MKIKVSLELYRKALEKQLKDEAIRLSQDAVNEINLALQHMRNAEAKIGVGMAASEQTKL